MKLKKNKKPFHNINERAAILSAIAYVDLESLGVGVGEDEELILGDGEF